jgi:hypothetical protein
MKATIIVPTHLSEITLKQYQRFLKIQEINDDNYFIQCKMIEIFCNISHKDVLTIKMSDAEMITKKLSDLLSQKPKLVDSFYIGSLEFGFHPDIEDMTLGEYIDLDTYIGDWQNIETAMNVLYRPIKERKKNKYSIKGYTPEDKDIMIHMPLDAVIGSVFFLLNLGIDLSIAMSHYLQEETKKQQVLDRDLDNVGDGIKVFTDSLTEILQNLKISQN